MYHPFGVIKWGKVAEILNNYFVNITEALDLANECEQESLNDQEDGPCLTIVEQFQSHSSVLKTKSFKLLLQEDNSRRNARTFEKFRS